MRKYRVLAGQHIDSDYRKQPQQLEDNRGKPYQRYPSRVYGKGDIVEVEDSVDLAKKFGYDRFELIGQEPGVSAKQTAMERQETLNAQKAAGTVATVGKTAFTTDELYSLTVRELQELASEEEIDLRGARTKEDIIRMIQNTSV